MNLQIINPTKTETHEVLWIEATTAIGNFVIQPGHIPVILSLKPDSELIFCLKNGKQEAIIVNKGILEITRTSATALLSQAL